MAAWRSDEEKEIFASRGDYFGCYVLYVIYRQGTVLGMYISVFSANTIALSVGVVDRLNAITGQNADYIVTVFLGNGGCFD